MNDRHDDGAEEKNAAAVLAATRAAYDAIAVPYAERFVAELAAQPCARSILQAFAELVSEGGGGRIADVGSGPGNVTAFLDSLGGDAFGVDLSRGMVTLASRTHPHLPFVEGSMTALPIRDDVLGGVVAWYSVIHLPPDRLPAVLAEFRRALRPGGCLLLAFQVGTDVLRLDEAFGQEVALDFYRLTPDGVAGALDAAGFVEVARLIRAATDAERTPQAHVISRKPAERGLRSGESSRPKGQEPEDVPVVRGVGMTGA
ncbi:MAG TPA: methyltransferase domain-containing protein [Acidimicrobiia bacterium]|nr:methyltransferase domain-containing protein [Acidimicrobiia bacterium]